MENVFARGENESTGLRISEGMYNLTIGLVLCWGFFVNWYIVQNVPVTSLMRFNPILLIILYFASCFFGVYLYTKSSNPLISFVGYNFVVVPFGLIVNLVVHQYAPQLVVEAIRITGFVTMVMMLLGVLFPGFFQKIIGALSIALIAVIIVEAVEIFIFKMHQGFLNWIVALIFCGYIGYDWGRANAIPKTLDNAVDSAAALYMDIINLFLRILSILGERK